MTKRNHQPQRTCMGCGTRDRKDRLIRLTLVDQNRLVPDLMRGRGGYLHRKHDCWRAFLGRKSHYRAFRAEVSHAAKKELVQQLQDRNWE